MANENYSLNSRFFFFQLFSNMLLNTIINNILKTSNTVIVIFDLDHIQLLNQFALLLKVQASLYFLYTVTEIVLVKYWMRFILKRLVTMDDAFIAFVLTLENLTMSILFAIARVMISDETIMPQFGSAESRL